LASENARISQNEQRLNVENVYLKGQVESLKAALANTGFASVFNRGMTCLSELQQTVVPAPSYPKPPNFAALNPMNVTSGLVLMVLLFAFGIVFGNMAILNEGMIREHSPEMTHGRIFKHDDFEPLSNPQQFDAFDDPNLPFVGRMKQQISQISKAVSGVEQLAKETPMIQEPVKVETVEAQPAETSSSEKFLWKQNATYLVCPTVEQLTPPKKGPWNENETDPVVVFLIPPSSFGAADDRDTTLEVTCQVMGVQTVAHSSLRIGSTLSLGIPT